MKTFEEVTKYYKFPLHVNDYCSMYIETKDNKTAFNILFVDNEDCNYFNKIVQKLNDPESIDLHDTFSIKKDTIISEKYNKPILLVRGWGMLIGIGANHLDTTYAAEIQDSFICLCCERLNMQV